MLGFGEGDEDFLGFIATREAKRCEAIFEMGVRALFSEIGFTSAVRANVVIPKFKSRGRGIFDVHHVDEHISIPSSDEGIFDRIVD